MSGEKERLQSSLFPFRRKLKKAPNKLTEEMSHISAWKRHIKIKERGQFALLLSYPQTGEERGKMKLTPRRTQQLTCEWCHACANIPGLKLFRWHTTWHLVHQSSQRYSRVILSRHRSDIPWPERNELLVVRQQRRTVSELVTSFKTHFFWLLFTNFNKNYMLLLN